MVVRVKRMQMLELERSALCALKDRNGMNEHEHGEDAEVRTDRGFGRSLVVASQPDGFARSLRNCPA
ncbi:hypothetical protein LBM2029_09145 [Ralstonia solanacearum]|nr:hypothetical protein LBM2029_09145 [Ralstonia solanacearum]